MAARARILKVLVRVWLFYLQVLVAVLGYMLPDCKEFFFLSSLDRLMICKSCIYYSVELYQGG